MKKINRNELNAIWKMRHLTVREFLIEIKSYPNFQFLVKAFGIMWLLGIAATLTVGINVMIYVYRIFNLVLG